MIFKSCACGCGKHFPLTRADRMYYDKSCRNRVSNSALRVRQAYIVIQRQNAEKQDQTLDRLTSNYPNGYILFDERFLSKYGIDLSFALSVQKDVEGNILQALFNRHALVRVKEGSYQLKKIKR